MSIENEDKILQTLLPLCPSPPKESPPSANLVLPESSEDDEIFQEIVKVSKIKNKKANSYSYK